MEIKRDKYLKKLLVRRNNGMIKIITGIRRCGKSYLLFRLFADKLLADGIDEEHIIRMELDRYENKDLRNPDVLYAFVKKQLKDERQYYLLLDEVQLLPDFESVLNSFLHIPNLDVYVTGSNSKFLSSDIITEFRGRGDQIRVSPLTFAEIYNFSGKPYQQLLPDFLRFGGMPLVVLMENEEQKKEYLQSLFDNVYINDVVERNDIRLKEDLDDLVNVLASVTGSVTNAHKIADTFKSQKQNGCSYFTIAKYIDFLKDAFMISEAKRYDIKGRRYINAGRKYYFADHGLRNARLNFMQQDKSFLMENLVYNELKSRGYSVNVGVVERTERNVEGIRQKKQHEVDFIAERAERKYYIQSCMQINTTEKLEQELASLKYIDDSFRKVIIRQDLAFSAPDDDGIYHLKLEDFLLKENNLDY